MSRPPVIRRIALVACLAAVAACGQAAPTAPYTRVTDSAIAAVDALPAPRGGAVLTISGDVTKGNDGDDVTLDLATIEQMGLVRYTAHDPWLDDDLEFTGVLLTDLLQAVGAPSDAETLVVTALDDYVVEIAIDDARRWPVMLATQTGGAPMSIEDKGPTRIVFPDDPSIDTLRYKDLWIWQITTIEVE